MNMNEYWEKYKNRNKGQEPTQQSFDKFQSDPMIEHFSHLQSQINSLEDKYLELHSKLSASFAYENHFSGHQHQYPDKYDRIEKSLNFLEERITKIEENNNFFKYENLRMELIKELNLTENKISQYFGSEILALNQRVKEISDKGRETKRNTVRFDEPVQEGKVDQEWQKKIEKIVIICAEKLKDIEDRNGGRGEAGNIEVVLKSVKKMKNFRINVIKRLDELEEFSKKLCKKFLSIENSPGLLSPMAKHVKNESNLSFSGKKVVGDGGKAKKSCEPKKVKSRSVSPTDKKGEKNKVQNKLEKLYKDLRSAS